ncbi:hypothetical protein EDC94DRAFT_588377 [Helicostylum pulchrum]|nr:hypothetical protein EDC94DRAFT_588377 [Helicostylum pulchrum]
MNGLDTDCRTIIHFESYTISGYYSTLTQLPSDYSNNILSNTPSSFTLTEPLINIPDESTNSINLPPTRVNNRQSYIPNAITMGDTPTKHSDDKVTAISKDNTIPPGSNITSSDLDYSRVQTPEWMLTITADIREIQTQLTSVLGQNKLLEQKVNSFSGTEILLQKARKELATAHHEIKLLEDQLTLAQQSKTNDIVSISILDADEVREFPALPNARNHSFGVISVI